MSTNLYSVAGKNARLVLHPGQVRVWDSRARFVLMLAGTQGGKTSFGPWWLWREIERAGPGDYLAVTATYDLFKLKMLPEIRAVFALFGYTYRASDRLLESEDGLTRLILRSAEAEGGLESATARAAWFDEAGQVYDAQPWDAIQRRLSLARGRCLITTTPYSVNTWLKTDFYDRWRMGDPDYDVIQFESRENPAFPAEEFERARATLPDWKFQMFYRGVFQKPEGLVYQQFGAQHIRRRTDDRFVEWLIAVDEGFTNPMAILLCGIDHDGRWHVAREFYRSGVLQAEVVALIAEWCHELPIAAVVVDEAAAGLVAALREARLPAVGHKGRVVDGIVTVAGLLATARDGAPHLTVDPDCQNLIREFESYAWRPGREEPVKENDHALDALRYAVNWRLNSYQTVTTWIGQPRVYAGY
jgi:phage terminase large subunit-like protein